ncbi:MAG TPA: sigma-54 dependent transcriptional regulator, partial [Polyangiaceae bacterium]|nr:sigma-54 dependent transcriptional regulator [Polyangiaceae bacterium]
GKEVVADLIHEKSGRRGRPLVKVNCAALPDALLESELFGYERGAFTGAEGERAGLFELANGGTLFFDEIGELPLDMQPKLLRVLEDRRITRVGGRTLRPVDVRIIAATNRDLASEVACGAFRSDLYFRLNGFVLAIPPLRERRVEIPGLARALLERACAERRRSVPRISPAALERLEKHDWPGNVRELRNVLARMLLLAPPGAQELGDNEVTRALVEPLARREGTDEDEERTRILDALARSGGNQAEAAAALGMARRTLLYKLDRLGIPRPRKRRR